MITRKEAVEKRPGAVNPSGFEIINLSRNHFEAKIGVTRISVVTAKEPHKPWDPTLKDVVLAARKQYWETWGMIPLEDGLDEVSYVDVAFVSYPKPRHSSGAKRKAITEGLTMRTVLINGSTFEGNDRLPDDLRFWVGPHMQPLFDLLTDKLYDGNKEVAREKISVASRVAPIRPEGRGHNSYTPEAFSAIQVKTAFRSIEDGVEYFVNTMREEMEGDVLALPNGVRYKHIRTEDALGLKRGDIQLNRYDPFVLTHIFNYLGYFTRTEEFIKLIKEMLHTNPRILDLDTLEVLGVPLHRLDQLKATQLKPFIPLVNQSEPITSHLTGEEFRARIIHEVGDGPSSYLMTTGERYDEGIKILNESSKLAWHI